MPQGFADDWILIYVALVIGSSIFLIPYALGQSGFFTFLLLLAMEIYFTGQSKIYLFEMATYKKNSEKSTAESAHATGKMPKKEKSKMSNALTDAAESNQASDGKSEMSTPTYTTIVRDVTGQNSIWAKVANWLFIIDIVICTTFYFKITAMLPLYYWDIESLPPFQQGLLEANAYILISLYLILTQYGKKLWDATKSHPVQADRPAGTNKDSNATPNDPHRVEADRPAGTSKDSNATPNDPQLNSQVNISDSYIGNFIYDSDKPDKDHGLTKTEDVANQLYNPDRRGTVRLIFLMFFFFIQCEIDFQLYFNEDLKSEWYNSTECPGFMSPKIFKSTGVEVFYVLPLIIFALMNYAIAVPVSSKQLNLEDQDYRRLVRNSRRALFMLFTILPGSFYLVLGESTPVIATMAYGKNIAGFTLTTLAFIICLNAIWLRVMLCCRLIQAFFDAPYERHHWIIVMGLFLPSYFIAMRVKNIIRIAVFAGLVNCNLILNIIPCGLYIIFKSKDGGLRHAMSNQDVRMASLQLVIHVLLLFSTIPALLAVNPDVGMSCSSVFNEIWG